MSETKELPAPGTILWTDLTVPDTERLRDFYAHVVGWSPQPIDMGNYTDFNMLIPATEKAVAGICHAQGINSNLPAQWLNYVVVANLDQCLKTCIHLGGKLLHGPRGSASEGRLAVIQDPAGACIALVEFSTD